MLSSPMNHSLDEKLAPANKADKPGAVSVAAQEAARLDRRIADKRGEEQQQQPREVEQAPLSIIPGVVASTSAFEEVVKTTNNPTTTTTTEIHGAGMVETTKKNVMMEDVKKSVEVAMEDALIKKEDETAPVMMMTPEKDLAKENVAPLETMPAPSPVLTTTADHGIVQEPDVEYGVYEPNEDGLAVAVAVAEDDDDVFIPSAVEYDPDAKPPLHRNRRFRLYGFLAFFALVACAVATTIAIVVGNGDSDVEVHPREKLGIRDLVERVVGQEKLTEFDSPYAKALNWIIFEDPVEPVPEDSNFIQRYILAYFAFSMKGETEWLSCGPANITKGHTDSCNWQELANTNPVIFVQEPRFRWLSSAHECDWAGIRCDLDKQVRAIEFGGQNLEGKWPEGLMHLPFLQSLEIPMNGIRGSIPTEVGTMKHLVNLEMSFNSITGTLPDELYEMKSLLRVNFAKNQMHGTISTKIGQLRDLKGFFLSENDFTGTIPTELGSLQSLTYLRLDENRFGGKFPLELGDLHALEEFWLADNGLTGTIPPGIGNMINMKDLRFRRNPLLGGVWPSAFWKSPDLNWFDIRGCNFTGSLGPGIGGMQDLVFFRISGNPFSGTIPKEMGNLEYLASFWLDRTDITGTMPPEICAAQSHQNFNDLNADCLGPEPEIECPCCTGCCLVDGSGCKKMD